MCIAQKENKDYFYNCLETAKIGENLVKEMLKEKEYEVIDVSDDEEWQKKDVDLIIYKNGKKIFALEVKTDERALSTQNVFIETISNKKNGWVWKTEADYIYIVIPTKKIYILYKDEFVPWFQKNMHSFKSRSSNTSNKYGELMYKNWGRLVPVKTLDSLEFASVIQLGE